MSQRVTRHIVAKGGRGIQASPVRRRPIGSNAARLNRILLLGGSALALGAVLLAVVVRPFNPQMLLIDLAAIGLGLLMGKGIGMFMFRRVLPSPK